MAKGLITHAYLEDTADAIRVLRGESNTYTPDEFGEKIINAIPTEEVTDNIVSVTDAAAYPAEKLEFAIEPVQDLHGYDKPWPAGGGKNLFGGVYGTKFVLPTPLQVYSGDSLTISASIPASGNSRINLYTGEGGTTRYFNAGLNDTINGRRVRIATFNEDVIITAFLMDVAECTDIQIEKGSTATAYEPYSNICPISGWTGVNGERTGKNLLDPDKMVGYSSGRGYRWYENDGYVLKANQTYAFSVSNTSESVRLYVIEKTTENNLVDASSFLTYTPTEDITVYFQAYRQQGIGEANNFQLELGNQATSYEPYQGISIPIAFPTEAGTVYGGKVDVVNGKLLAYPEYDSYNGETLTGEWISSMDAYVAGTTPTIGAQVVDLSGVGTEYDITPQQVELLLGNNNIWCDTGDTTLEYKVDLGRYIEKLKASQ